MVATRLRPAWSDAQLAEIYAQPHDHRIYGRGHGERVHAMILQGRALVADGVELQTIADLSCGNGAVALDVANAVRLTTGVEPLVILGDYAPGYALTGPLEKTVDQLPPQVDLYVCGETLEHLDDPPAVLHRLAGVARWLLLSTPTENWGDTNAQHYWAWSDADVTAMLEDAGFAVREFAVVDSRTYGEPYRYGIWTAERRDDDHGSVREG